jgi:hypothetical protein
MKEVRQFWDKVVRDGWFENENQLWRVVPALFLSGSGGIPEHLPFNMRRRRLQR